MIAPVSPFKFLDSYDQKDVDIFFGREQETEKLYEALSGVKHLLVYGPSGAGKTSLIECGLRNQFSDADWFAISIRRADNMIAATFARINEALEDPFELDPVTGLPVDDKLDFGQAIERIFNERFQPVYLLFDQFEELLISGSQMEKADFFTRLNQLIRFRVPCRVILIMREEFIGHLSEFEYFCPTIFEHRFRLEKMTRNNVQDLIQAILEAPYYDSFFRVEDPGSMARHIIHKLPDERREIDLSHLQVYLSELWQRAQQGHHGPSVPILNTSLLRRDDNLATVLNNFLRYQLAELKTPFGESLPLEVLAAMISERHTKLQLNRKGLEAELLRHHIESPNNLTDLLESLEGRRIIRKLKSGSQAQYEISHDTLATVVGQNLSEEMKLREKAQELYRVALEREGHFSQGELDQLRPYEAYLPYPSELLQRIEASEAYWQAEAKRQLQETKAQLEKEFSLREDAEKNAKKARQRTRFATLVASIALISSIAAGVSFLKAESAKRDAELATEDAICAKIDADAEKIDANLKKSWAEESTKDAQQQTNKLKDEKALTNKLLNEKTIRVNQLKAEIDARVQAEVQTQEEIRKNIALRIPELEILFKAGYIREAIIIIDEDLLPGAPKHAKLLALKKKFQTLQPSRTSSQ